MPSRRRVRLRYELRESGRVVTALIFTALLYLLIGMLFATLPPFVHGDLGYSTLVAGGIISLQYVTTFMSRAAAGRTADTRGPKRAVTIGFAVGTASSAALLAATLMAERPGWSLAALCMSRLALGVAESFAGTGTIAWGVGRLGAPRLARILSWNGMLSYGGLAVGAPLGVFIVNQADPVALGIACTIIAAGAWLLASVRAPTVPTAGEHLGFRAVLLRVLPYGSALALASTGFGTIAAFVTLFYLARGWSGAAYALSSFGICFAAFRFVLSGVIARFGGLRVALGAMAVEAAGLVLLAAANSAAMASLAAAVVGLGFSPMFPALGVEAVATVPPASRGSAIGTYNLFADVAMVFVGPAAGLIASHLGYGGVYFGAAACVGAAAVIAALLLAVRRRRATFIDAAPGLRHRPAVPGQT